MDKLVRKIEIPLAKRAIEKAGLYIVQPKDLDRLAEIAADAYQDYPLHNWFTKGKYDEKASKLIMQIAIWFYWQQNSAVFGKRWIKTYFSFWPGHYWQAFDL